MVIFCIFIHKTKSSYTRPFARHSGAHQPHLSQLDICRSKAHSMAGKWLSAALLCRTISCYSWWWRWRVESRIECAQTAEAFHHQQPTAGDDVPAENRSVQHCRTFITGFHLCDAHKRRRWVAGRSLFCVVSAILSWGFQNWNFSLSLFSSALQKPLRSAARGNHK